jgi:hypothetical protein
MEEKNGVPDGYKSSHCVLENHVISTCLLTIGQDSRSNDNRQEAHTNKVSARLFQRKVRHVGNGKCAYSGNLIVIYVTYAGREISRMSTLFSANAVNFFLQRYNIFCTHCLKISISRLSSERGKSDLPHAVFFTLQQKLGDIALYLSC